MPFNLSGSLAALGVLLNPRSIVPSLTVPDIRYLNWRLLWEHGYRGVVVDRDNCITRPHEDQLIPELKDSFEECKKTFGPERVLIVSNSAGTPLDAGYLAAEALQRNLGVPVLKHTSMKPSKECMKSIRDYFDTLVIPDISGDFVAEKSPPPVVVNHPDGARLITIGDRVLTDVLMGNHRNLGSGNLTILTQSVWAPEGLGMRFLRTGETYLAGLISQREEIKPQLKEFSQYLRTSDEVSRGKTEASKGHTRAEPEKLWEGRS